ncbi:MAG: O-antigen ligase domain-containing protein [Phycisphaeraceae bacterium]|nr:MAG: O-antigen ligase domain-containing protein [Phycisphaeraceae bacterium]
MNRIAQRLAVIGWLAIVGSALLRVMTEHTLLAYWDIDPLVVDIPETRLTPAMSLALDGAVWIGSLALIIGQWLMNQPLMWRSGILLAVAACGVFWHGLIATPYATAPGTFSGHPDGLVIASYWIAAMVGAWSLAHLARDEHWRRLTVATLIGIIFVLVGHGIVHVFIEHAQTLAEYRSNPELFLRARGFEPGSVQALEFERRLSNPEAIGWFGLTNVFATFAAVGFGAGVGILLSLLGGRTARTLAALVVGLSLLVAGMMGLWLSGAKGGYGAAVVSVGAVLVVQMFGRHTAKARKKVADGPAHAAERPADRLLASRLGWLIGAGVIILPILGVVFRGLIGERIGELSMLFRWHYFIASARIFLESPVAGVGPGAFQDAYALAKPMVNPEWASSPHNVILEWIATLGVAGIALAIVWCVFVCSAAHRAIDESVRSEEREVDFPKRMIVLGGIAAIGASIIAWSIDAPVTTDASFAGRSFGLLIWLGILFCFAFARFSRCAMALAGLGAVAAIASHAQIEVTATHPGAAAWCALLLGACGGFIPSPTRATRNSHRAYLPAIVLLVLGTAATVASGRKAGEWEAVLQEGRDNAQRRLAMGQMRAAVEVAADTMREAERVWPGRLGVRTSEIGYRVSLAEPGADLVFLVEPLTWDFPGRAGAWVTRGQLLLLVGEGDDSVAAFEEAHRLDPGSLRIGMLGLRAAKLGGDPDQVTRWAERVLRIDEFLRLDPLKRLSDEERREIEGLLAGVASTVP